MTEIIFTIIFLLISIGWLRESYYSGLIAKIASLLGLLLGGLGAFLLYEYLPLQEEASFAISFFIIGALARSILDKIANLFRFIDFIPLAGLFSRMSGSVLGLIEVIAIYRLLDFYLLNYFTEIHSSYNDFFLHQIIMTITSFI